MTDNKSNPADEQPKDVLPYATPGQSPEPLDDADDVDDPEALRQAEMELENSLADEDAAVGMSPQEMGKSGPPRNWVMVGEFGTPIEAHIVAGMLEEEGIASFIEGENVYSLNILNATRSGVIKLMVAKADSDRAAKLLRERRAEAIPGAAKAKPQDDQPPGE